MAQGPSKASQNTDNKSRHLIVNINKVGNVSPEKAVLVEFHGQERVSDVFHFHLELYFDCEVDPPKDLLGKFVSFDVKSATNAKYKRSFSGYINHMVGKGTFRQKYDVYSVEIVPWAWFLTQTQDCHIFQERTVLNVIEDIFKKYKGMNFNYEIRMPTQNFQPMEYCVQYRESDWHFVSRLMEEFGIYYFFEHSASESKLIMMNAISTHKECPGYEGHEFPFDAENDDLASANSIVSWEEVFGIVPNEVELLDYEFKDCKQKKGKSTIDKNPDHKLKIYDFQNFRYSGKGEQTRVISADREKIEQEIENVSSIQYIGQSFCLPFHAGHEFLFKVSGEKYFLLSMAYRLENPLYKDDEAIATFGNSFLAIPAQTQFREERKTNVPLIEGIQTATVVGPKGEEIWTDEYGRIKVHFHWDHHNSKMDDSCSCWIRVAQNFAGKGYGGMTLPRIGHEVIVSFLEGDPDRPIVTGCVYNGNNPTGLLGDYKIKDNKTRSWYRDQSSKNGGPEDYNGGYLESERGSEYIYMQAQKDLEFYVKNDETWKIDNDRKMEILGHETKDVIKNQTHTTGGNFTSTVTGNETHTIQQNYMSTVSGNYDVKVSGLVSIYTPLPINIKSETIINLTCPAMTINVIGKTEVNSIAPYSLTSPKSITFQVGASKLELLPDKIILSVGPHYQICIDGKAGITVDTKSKKGMPLARKGDKAPPTAIAEGTDD